jgi:hypothetical protein
MYPKRKASNPTKQTSEAQLEDDDDDVDEANAADLLFPTLNKRLSELADYRENHGTAMF